MFPDMFLSDRVVVDVPYKVGNQLDFIKNMVFSTLYLTPKEILTDRQNKLPLEIVDADSFW